MWNLQEGQTKLRLVGSFFVCDFSVLFGIAVNLCQLWFWGGGAFHQLQKKLASTLSRRKLLLHYDFRKISQKVVGESISSTEGLFYFFFLYKRTFKIKSSEELLERQFLRKLRTSCSWERWQPRQPCTCSLYFLLFQPVLSGLSVILYNSVPHPPQIHTTTSLNPTENTLCIFKCAKTWIGNTKCAFLNLILVDKRPSRFQVGCVHQN